MADMPLSTATHGETDRRRKRGRPVGDRQAKSGELIAAARSVIARDGYGAASLRKVAEEAGAASTGAVSYYFTSKEAMVLAVAENLFDEFDAWLEGLGGGCDAKALCDAMLLWTTRGGGGAWLVALQLLVGARSDKALAAVIERRNGRFMANLTRLL